MSMDWFRSWHGAPTDPKWLLIAKRSETQAGIVSAIVWALFDHGSQNSDDRGNVEAFDTETYAAFSGFEEPAVKRVIECLKEKNIIVDGHLSAWEKRQTKREDNSTPRVQKHRNTKKRNETQETARVEEIREEKKEDDAEAPRARTSLISPEAQQLADELLVIAGHELKFIPPGWCGAAMRVQAWLAEWPREIILSAVTAAANRKRGPPANRLEYFEPAVAEEFARQSAPLAQVDISKLTGHGHAKPKSAITQAADDLVRKLASFDGPARTPDELRSGEGETPPRLLSHG